MQILTTDNIRLEIANKESIKSLYRLAEKDILNLGYTEESESLIKAINQLNYLHHNDSNFFNKMKSIFCTQDGYQIIEGQEDIAGISKDNTTVIFRTAEPGVNLSVKIKEGSLSESISNIVFIAQSLVTGFNNPKEFQSLLLSDKLSRDLRNTTFNTKRSKI